MVMRVEDLFREYLHSKDYLQLSSSSQVSYTQVLSKLEDVKVGRTTLGRTNLKTLSGSHCRNLYDHLVDTVSVANANYCFVILSIVFNYGMRLEYTDSNPTRLVKRLRHTPHTDLWTREQVQTFLEVAYSDFSTRNIGLLVHMCYEWAQRPVDIRELTWDEVNFTSGYVTITQRKTGAVVNLPLEDPILELLEQQHEDWGFQPHVLVNEKIQGLAYVPMSKSLMNARFRKVRDLAGLPKELTIGVLRKVAINEFLEAGVDTPQVMSVTGHKNIKSLNPYVKHRLETAKTAFNTRKEIK